MVGDGNENVNNKCSILNFVQCAKECNGCKMSLQDQEYV